MKTAKKIDFVQFLQDVRGMRLSDLRCDDAPPTPAVLILMDRYGKKYEAFVIRLQRLEGAPY